VGNPAVLDLVAARFILVPTEQDLPGFHKVMGPVGTATGGPGVLYERDSAVAYARVLSAAVKVPDDQTVPALIDSRFPHRSVLVYPDTATATVEPIRAGQVPPPATVTAEVTDWEPGRMRIVLSGPSAGPAYLLVSENWYPDWHATVDGKAAPVHRGDYAFLSVALPPGAREVRLDFASRAYSRGKLISGVALLATLGLFAATVVGKRLGRTGD
jgi:hypothetical protein